VRWRKQCEGAASVACTMTEPNSQSHRHSFAGSDQTASDQVTHGLINCWLILCVGACLVAAVVCSCAWLFGGVGETLVGLVAPGWVRWCVYLPGAMIIVVAFAWVRSYLRSRVWGDSGED